MDKKIGFIVLSTLFLVISLLSTSFLVFSQGRTWDRCRISAYGTDFVETEVSFVFYAADPPAGSEISNTIIVENYDTGENYTENLIAGDLVTILWRNAAIMNIAPASDPDFYTIVYDGETTWASINTVDIPEFPPILIVPLFMTATLLAIIYRKKRIK